VVVEIMVGMAVAVAALATFSDPCCPWSQASVHKDKSFSKQVRPMKELIHIFFCYQKS
jgi:Na+/H+ antiporter NhaC